MSNSLWPHESQHARPPCPSPTPGVYSNSCPSTHKNKIKGFKLNSKKKVAFSLCQSYIIPHSPYYPKSSEITTWNSLSWSHGSVASILWKCNQTLIIWNKKKTSRNGMVSCWGQNETVNHSSFCHSLSWSGPHVPVCAPPTVHGLQASSLGQAL